MFFAADFSNCNSVQSKKQTAKINSTAITTTSLTYKSIDSNYEYHSIRFSTKELHRHPLISTIKPFEASASSLTSKRTKGKYRQKFTILKNFEIANFTEIFDRHFERANIKKNLPQYNTHPHSHHLPFDLPIAAALRNAESVLSYCCSTTCSCLCSAYIRPLRIITVCTSAF